MNISLNFLGGTILFGISDEAEIIGIAKKDLDEIDKFLTNVCEEKTRPRVRVTKNSTESNNEIIGVFEVDKSKKIVQNVYDKHYYIRRGSTNRIMRPEEIESYSRNTLSKPAF